MPAIPPDSTASRAPSTRGAARREQTRAALITAAQALTAEGRTEVSVEEITRRADVGLGSFYNHFADKAELWGAALAATLDAHGEQVAALTAGVIDPAEVVCVGLRLTSRMVGASPQIAAFLLHTQVGKLVAEGGLVEHLRADIASAVSAGRFSLGSVDVGVAMAVGGVIGLLDVLARQPADDAAGLVDDLVFRLLLGFGMEAEEAQRLVALPLT